MEPKAVQIVAQNARIEAQQIRQQAVREIKNIRRQSSCKEEVGF